MNHKKLTFIDLFAGCGGLTEGFLQSGYFEGLAHVEWELPMVNTLRHRLETKWDHTAEDAKKRVVHFDIQKTDELINGNWSKETLVAYGKTNHSAHADYGLRGFIPKSQQVDMIIGGPPCQAYSIAGRAQDKNSMKDDYRNYLFESFVKVVKEFQPRAFLFENVPGMLSACPGGEKVTKRVFDAFKAAGYTILESEKLQDAVFTASDFGVPQKRRRVIIIGVKGNGKMQQLKDIYITIQSMVGNIPSKSVKDTIGHLPPLTPLVSSVKINGKNVSHQPKIKKTEVAFHEPRFHNDRDVKIFQEWVGSEMNSKTSDEKIAFYNNLMGKKSNHAKYRNLEWDKPSPTIVAHLYKDGLMFIHPDKKQARSITVKEAALLQSFPDDFEFIGSQGVCYKMIGNAVPPALAEVLAEQIYEKIK